MQNKLLFSGLAALLLVPVLALAAPGEMWLAGEGAKAPALVAAAYTAEGASGKLQTFGGAGEEKLAAAVTWLTRP